MIALDSLVNSPAWTASDSAVLVTFGSPIRRFFIRFFPRYLFPASVDASARIVASRLRHFTWINIHRRWDYVGSGLGLGRAGLGADICTGQGWRVLSSHSNYWEDAVVIGALERQLRAIIPVAREPQAVAPPHLMPVAGTSGIPGRVAQLAWKLALAVIVGAVALATFNFVQSRGTWRRGIEADLAQLRESGSQTLADVTYYETVEAATEDHAVTIQHFAFRLPELNRELPPIAISDSELYQEPAYRFDHLALARFVLEKCVRAEEKKWWQVFKRVKSIPCTRTAIPFMYRANNPASFWLPGFPVRMGAAHTFGEVFGGLFGIAAFALICGVVILGGWVPLFRLFLGLSARGAKS